MTPFAPEKTYPHGTRASYTNNACRYDEMGWLLVKTEKLKVLCREARAQGREACGGDGGRARGVLLPVAWCVPRPR